MMNSVKVVSISGIPGVGKSTLIERLQKDNCLRDRVSNHAIELRFVKEPSDLWREYGWLKQFYASPDKRALSFQCLVFDSHVDTVAAEVPVEEEEGPVKKKTFQKLVLIVERCMYDQLLFWKVQCDLKRESAEPMDDQAYCRMWSKWTRLIPPVRIVFHCNTSSIEEVMRRVKERGREEEQAGLTLEYQTSLLNKHNEWYASDPGRTSIPHIPTNVPCVQISLDASLSDESAFSETLETIAQRICNLFMEFSSM